MATITSFGALSEQFIKDLQTLASESKRRSSDIRHSCEKSIEILKRSNSVEELARHPDFIDPFISACLSGNAKLTSVSMHSMQRISGIRCIPSEKIDAVLNALLTSTKLASDIQLKVLQLIPILFKTYVDVITNKLLAKLFLCCTTLLQQPNRTAVLLGTVSATLQQLVNEVFDRCKLDCASENSMQVPISNEKISAVNKYRYDAHIVLCNLSQLTDSHDYENVIIDIKNVPEDCGLEILEFVISNHASSICAFEDLLFLLRTRVVPLLLRTFSASKSFPIAMRTARCIGLLISTQFFDHLELESEIMLWLLIHTLSKDSESPMWKKIMSLEIFDNCSKDFKLINKIFQSYDNLDDRKDICASLLTSVQTMIESAEYQTLLNESDVLYKGDTLILSQDINTSKSALLNLLDKSSPPLIDQTYIIYLLLNISNNFSDGLGSLASSSDLQEAKELDKLKEFHRKLYPMLFQIHKRFLHATTLDTHLFHSLIRAFQKLTLACGILSAENELNESLNLFSVLIVNNISRKTEGDLGTTTTSTVLSSISDTLVNVAANLGEKSSDKTDLNIFHPRNFNQRHLNLFRALISLSISLGSTFNSKNWNYIFISWQWVSYYIYGPSADFLETYYGKDVVPTTDASKQDVNAYEISIKKFIESTINFSHPAISIIIKTLIEESHEAFKLKAHSIQSPISECGTVQICVYKQSFFVTQMSEILVANYKRILADSNEDIWNSSTNFMISQIVNRELSGTELRLYISRVFSDTIVELSVKCNAENDSSSNLSSKMQDLIMKSLLELIDKIRSLPISNESVYNNNTNVESDIILQALKTLNDLLDNFGESTTSWNVVFEILNSPFQVISNGSSEPINEESESNISQVIIQKHKDMIKMSFEVFKLISDNFLQILPLNIIKTLIDTLFNFVVQERDLNISFSSISQFWLIGDCLRMQRGDEKLGEKSAYEFINLVKQGEWISIVEGNAPVPQKLKALWIYLLKTVVRCATDTRLEVRNGSIQTFFGMLDSNSNHFPSWSLIATEVLNPLISFELPADKADDYAESVQLTLKGLLQVYSKHLASFTSEADTAKHWDVLVNKIGQLMHSTAFDVVYVVCSSFKQLLEISYSIDNFPQSIVAQYCKIWSGYTIIYTSASTDDYRKKTNSDCLQAFVESFGSLYALCKKYSMIDSKFMEQSLSTINAIVRYPLLPNNVSDKLKPSPLQKSLLLALDAFDQDMTPELQVLLLAQLSSIIELPFDTRDRIIRKLSSKLGEYMISKIPSFEAVSYMAAEKLLQRFSNIESLRADFFDSKTFIKFVHSISQPLTKNSMICVSASIESPPLWDISADIFCILSEKTFDYLDETPSFKDNQNIDEYLKILINALISSLVKDGNTKDDKTERYALKIYFQLKELLVKCISLGLLTKEKIYPFGSALWSSSFYYEIDEVEDAVIKSCTNLEDIVKQFAQFNFEDILGSTKEPTLLPNHELTKVYLQDLIDLSMLQSPNSEDIREVCFSFMTARVAFVLRKFIADQQLLKLQPISKVKSDEIQQVSEGILRVLQFYSAIGLSQQDLKLLHEFYPLLLKTIPLSQKLTGLQETLLQIALLYAKLRE